MYHYPDSNMSNAVVALFSPLPAYFAAVVDQSIYSTVFAASLPFVFFLLGKATDVLIKLWLENRNSSETNKQDSNRRDP